MPSDWRRILLPVLTTDQKGAIAEQAIALEALKLGIGVYKPLAPERYDLIFDLRHELLRVQCKWASCQVDVVIVRCYSCRRSADGLVRSVYGPHEVDALAAYCSDLEQCYFVPIEAVPTSGAVQLRLTRPRNNQQRGIREAKRYEFAATLGRQQGAIAQLGERLDGIQKVAGSSPAGSIGETALRVQADGGR